MGKISDGVKKMAAVAKSLGAAPPKPKGTPWSAKPGKGPGSKSSKKK